MKPAWDQLASEYEGNPSIAIVDVDCTKDESKDVCSKYGVRGYPTIKYFTGSTDAQGDKYEGGRSLADLKKFVDENLGPSCGPDNMDLCSDAQKAEIQKFMDMDIEEVKKLADEKSAAIDAAEATFKEEVAGLQKKYESLMEEKDAAIAAIQPDLRVIRSVVAAAAKPAEEGKDEL
jgi:protein disulfide-isomerase A6